MLVERRRNATDRPVLLDLRLFAVPSFRNGNVVAAVVPDHGVVLADVPVEMSGQASGTQSTTRQLGSALGIAVLGTVLFSTLAGQLSTALDERGVPEQQRSAVVSAV